MTPLDKMPKPELMKYACSLVATRKQGTKLWRSVSDVRAEFKTREAAQLESSLGDALGPGVASSSQAAPSALGPGFASPGAGGAGGEQGPLGQAKSTQTAKSSAAIADTSNRAVGTGVPTARVRSSDMDNMKKTDLRKLAISLGVYSSRKCQTIDVLRVACKRVLGRQISLAASFAAAAPSQGGQIG